MARDDDLPAIRHDHKPGGHYVEEEVQRGLRALALCSGNTRRAEKVLTDLGSRVPRATLDKWARELHPDLYREICQEVRPELYARLAEANEDISRRLLELEGELADRVHETLPDMNGAQAATALRNVSIAKGVAADKSRTYRNEPVEIRESKGSVYELMRQGHRAFPRFFADPKEVFGEAEVIEEDDSPPA